MKSLEPSTHADFAGLGTRTDAYIAPVEAYIKQVYPNLRYLLTVCTGSALLARTGLLDGRRATTNKRSWAWATSQGPNVTWIPRARWVVDEPAGKVPIWSSSGVSAGIDLALAFAAKWYGADVATNTANSLEYEHHADDKFDPFSKIWSVPGA